MTLSIRAKVAIGMVLAVTVAVLLAGWLGLRAASEAELERTSADLLSRALLVRSALEADLANPGDPEAGAALSSKVRELARHANARIWVIDPTGRLLADSEATVPSMGEKGPGNDREVADALRTGQGTEVRYNPGMDRDELFLAVRSMHQDRVMGIIRLAIPLHALPLKSAQVRRAFAAALGIGILCALAIGLALTRSLTQPLAKMVKTARRFADGALNERLVPTERDELGVLASTLNRIADQLESTIREVSEDQAQLRAMLTAMVEGVMVLDADGTVLQINPALERMLLAPGIQARGRAHWEVIRHHELNELAKRVLETRQNRSGEISVASSGRTFQVEASVAGGRRANEACAVLVFHDVTPLRRLEKVRKDFVANVSHELRTPLTSIQGYAQALKDGRSGTPNQTTNFLEIILRQSERLNLILDDLLQLSQIESGVTVFKRDPVAVPSLVERAVAVIKPQSDKRGHRVLVSVPNDLPPVLGDEECLVQVLTNLLDNAVKYTTPNGTLAVAAALAKDADAEMVELAVTDSGIGIPETDRPRVFERFYRVDKARSRELGGTGLGLSIVKHIVEGHGGQVWVEGNHPVGSRFVVRLPTVSPEVNSDRDS